jgi:hypothetical protein
MVVVVSAADFVKVRMGLVSSSAAARLDKFGLSRAEDAEDDTNHLFSVTTQFPVACHIRYQNAAGVTDRVITIRKVTRQQGDLLLWCWCHKRSALRTFRVDRIVELICIASGQVFDRPEDFLRELDMIPHWASPEAAALALCQPEVNLLTIVGAADGLFDPDEQDVVVGFVFDTAGSLDLDEQVIRRRIAAYVPDLGAYEAALSHLPKLTPARRSSLMHALRRLIDSDGVCAREEQFFAAEIEDALAST